MGIHDVLIYKYAGLINDGLFFKHGVINLPCLFGIWKKIWSEGITWHDFSFPGGVQKPFLSFGSMLHNVTHHPGWFFIVVIFFAYWNALTTLRRWSQVPRGAQNMGLLPKSTNGTRREHPCFLHSEIKDFWNPRVMPVFWKAMWGKIWPMHTIAYLCFGSTQKVHLWALQELPYPEKKHYLSVLRISTFCC